MPGRRSWVDERSIAPRRDLPHATSQEQTGDVQTFDHLDRSEVLQATKTVANADIADYDGLVLPGGVANPDQLRTDADAVAFATSFVDAGKPVAAICHAPWTLVEADVVRGRRMTSWPSEQTDLRNAGADWVDEQLVVCREGPNTLVTSCKPDDLPAFTKAVVETFAGDRQPAG